MTKKKPELKGGKGKAETAAKSKKPVAAAWTEEEEKALTELLKVHKWSEWKDFAAHFKNRTACAVVSKMRKCLKASHKTKVKELAEIAQTRKKEFDLMRKNLFKFDNTPEEVDNDETEGSSDNNVINDEPSLKPKSIITEEPVDQDESIEELTTENSPEATEPVITETETQITTEITEAVQDGMNEDATDESPAISTETETAVEYVADNIEPEVSEPVDANSEVTTEGEPVETTEPDAVTEDAEMEIPESNTETVIEAVESLPEHTDIMESVPEPTEIVENVTEPIEAEQSEIQAPEETEPNEDKEMGTETVEAVIENTTADVDMDVSSEPFSVAEIATEDALLNSADVEKEISAEVVPVPLNDAQIVTEETPIESADIVMGAPENTEETVNDTTATILEPLVKKGRKTRAKTQTTQIKSLAKSPAKSPSKSSAKSPAKSPVKAAVTKRPYNRKTKPVAPVDVGEEVSILSSSESAGSSKESINIMSSSNSDESIPSLASTKSVRSTRSVKSDNVNSTDSVKSESVKSEDSSATAKSAKSTKSSRSVKSNNSETQSTSDKSIANDSSDSIPSVNSETEVPAWEKAACPAIFEKAGLKNPENRYKALKKRIENILKNSPEISLGGMTKKFHNEYSAKSVEQVFNIVKSGDNTKQEEDIVIPAKKVTKVARKQKETEVTETEGFNLLKKMALTSSGRKRKILSEEGDWISTDEIEGRVISHEPAQPAKEKRKKRVVKKTVEDEDLNTTEDPFRLILLHEFDDQSRVAIPGQVDENGDEFELVKAPFRVEMCDSVILLMDLHSHLHSSEIIGLLGGVFIKAEESSGSSLPVLRINYVFPCSTAHSTGTQVDVDPLSEMEAGDYFESNGVRMAGWYHSHPNFEPNPSLRDLETQTMYQGLFKNSEPDSNIEPFVGVIVNPYMAATESSSHVECFYVVPTIDPTQERLPYRLPIDRLPFDPQNFPQILEKMREIVFKAESSHDRLDMRKNAQPGVKRIEKLFASLRSHGNLSDDQMEQVKNLFN